MANVIKSIQQVSIVIAASASSNTATITGVTASNAIIVYQGANTPDTVDTSAELARVELTNGTTVTAFRGTTQTSTLTINAVVVEFSSGVNSIQKGTISISASTSGTATISAVGANAFVIFLGQTSTSGGDASDMAAAVVLTNSTTVTANTGKTTNTTVGYCVADLGASVVSAIQAVAHTDATSATSYTDTITSVTVGNALLFYNGILQSTTSELLANWLHTLQLTNSTTVTLTRNGTTTVSRTIKYTVVSFAAAALNGSVQRGTIIESSQSSNTATISSVATALSFCNYCGVQGAGAGFAASIGTLTLTNSTTVTFATGASSSQTGSYEVIQFLGASPFPPLDFPLPRIPPRLLASFDQPMGASLMTKALTRPPIGDYEYPPPPRGYGPAPPWLDSPMADSIRVQALSRPPISDYEYPLPPVGYGRAPPWLDSPMPDSIRAQALTRPPISNYEYPPPPKGYGPALPWLDSPMSDSIRAQALTRPPIGDYEYSLPAAWLSRRSILFETTSSVAINAGTGSGPLQTYFVANPGRFMNRRGG